MNDRRTQIIKRAIMDKLGHNINVFSSDDILCVANVDDAQINHLANIIENEASLMSEKVSVSDLTTQPTQKQKKGGR